MNPGSTLSPGIRICSIHSPFEMCQECVSVNNVMDVRIISAPRYIQCEKPLRVRDKEEN